MAAFASGSAPASARDAADAGAGVLGLRIGKEVNAECGLIPASQQGLLVRAHFLGGGEEEEEAEVFSTPPLTQQDPQRGQAGDGEDGITMCSMPFTPTQPSPPSLVSSSSSDSSERRPQKTRICTRKVRCGAKFRTPTPTPIPTPTPMRTPTPTPSPRPSPELDPLARMVLMIPAAPPPTTSIEDFFELGRSRGVF